MHKNPQILPAILNPKNQWEVEALKHRTKFCRIINKPLKGKIRWYVQLVQEGTSPKITHKGISRTIGTSEIGLDLGPSTVAIVSPSSNFAKLEKLAETVKYPYQKIKLINRAIARSRRATNPLNYNTNGTIKKGSKFQNKSKNYKTLQVKYSEINRKLGF